MANIQFKTVSDSYGITRGIRKVQINATGINPGAGVKAAELVDHGSLATLKFVNGAERTCGANAAIPTEMDRDMPVSVKVGFASDSNSGNIRIGLKYLHLAENDDVLGLGSELLLTVPVNTTLNGYSFTYFDLVSPLSTDSIVGMRFTRYGGDALDTTAGDLFLYGLSYVYTDL